MNGRVKVKNKPTRKPTTASVSTLSQGVGFNNASFLKQHLICRPDDASLKETLNRRGQDGNTHKIY